MKKRNWLEILVTGISAILVIGIFGVLIHRLIYEEQTPPDLVISVGTPVKASENFIVSINVENKGTTTAENVKIEVTDNNEQALLEFDFIPGGSTVTGWATFSVVPDATRLKARVLGFIEP